MAKRVWHVAGFDIYDLEIGSETDKFYYVGTPRAYGIFGGPHNAFFRKRIRKGERVHDDLQGALVYLLGQLNQSTIQARTDYERRMNEIEHRVREVTSMIKKGEK